MLDCLVGPRCRVVESAAARCGDVGDEGSGDVPPFLRPAGEGIVGVEVVMLCLLRLTFSKAKTDG